MNEPNTTGGDLERLLTDPNCVHANILRGVLPLTREQALHIAGATNRDALTTAIADMARDARLAFAIAAGKTIDPRIPALLQLIDATAGEVLAIPTDKPANITHVGGA